MSVCIVRQVEGRGACYGSHPPISSVITDCVKRGVIESCLVLRNETSSNNKVGEICLQDDLLIYMHIQF